LGQFRDPAVKRCAARARRRKTKSSKHGERGKARSFNVARNNENSFALIPAQKYFSENSEKISGFDGLKPRVAMAGAELRCECLKCGMRARVAAM
jgi:hypothetical protein